MRTQFLLFLLLITLGCPMVMLGQESPDASEDLILILDGSGSMWRELNGEHMIVSARDVLGTLVDELPPAKQVGLIAYGHNREGDCSDIETLVPVGALDTHALKSTINAIHPKGKTPITDSVNRAFEILRERNERASVISSTNPCIFALPEGTFNVSIKGIQFDGDVQKYFENVTISPGDTTALVADFSTGEVAIRVIRNSELSDAVIRITSPETGEQIDIGRSYTSAQSNPSIHALTAGTYHVTVSSVEIENEPSVTLEHVVIAPGDRIDHEISFESGTLNVGATLEGELLDVTVRVYNEEGAVAQGRTYTSDKTNPKTYILSPGTYSVTLKASRLEGSPEKIIEVEILKGETTTRMVGFEE